MIAPGNWLGVMGGGQLGRMFVHAAQTLGYRVCVLDPAPGSPAGVAADRQIVAAYDDPLALDELAAQCLAVTTEFENVPAASLAHLQTTLPVRPMASAVSTAQDREREKRFVQQCGVDVAPFAVIATLSAALQADSALFPGILKTAQMGYDGKGQLSVAQAADLAGAWQQLGGVPCVLEKRLPLQREISVIVSRNASGDIALFPVCENQHRAGILARTIMPARIDAHLAAKAGEFAIKIASGLSYVGVLCVEMFELEDGSLLVNEMAPRPHNSGHATIDACDSSQFDMQVRCLADLPLVTPQQLAPAVMLNLLGDIWFDAQGQWREPNWQEILALPGVRLHLYGKHEARPGRKMGHVTVLAASLESAVSMGDRVAEILGIPHEH